MNLNQYIKAMVRINLIIKEIYSLNEPNQIN